MHCWCSAGHAPRLLLLEGPRQEQDAGEDTPEPMTQRIQQSEAANDTWNEACKTNKQNRLRTQGGERAADLCQGCDLDGSQLGSNLIWLTELPGGVERKACKGHQHALTACPSLELSNPISFPLLVRPAQSMPEKLVILAS